MACKGEAYANNGRAEGAVCGSCSVSVVPAYTTVEKVYSFTDPMTMGAVWEDFQGDEDSGDLWDMPVAVQVHKTTRRRKIPKKVTVNEKTYPMREILETMGIDEEGVAGVIGSMTLNGYESPTEQVWEFLLERPAQFYKIAMKTMDKEPDAEMLKLLEGQLESPEEAARLGRKYPTIGLILDEEELLSRCWGWEASLPEQMDQETKQKFERAMGTWDNGWADYDDRRYASKILYNMIVQDRLPRKEREAVLKSFIAWARGNDWRSRDIAADQLFALLEKKKLTFSERGKVVDVIIDMTRDRKDDLRNWVCYKIADWANNGWLTREEIGRAAGKMIKNLRGKHGTAASAGALVKLVEGGLLTQHETDRIVKVMLNLGGFPRSLGSLVASGRLTQSMRDKAVTSLIVGMNGCFSYSSRYTCEASVNSLISLMKEGKLSDGEKRATIDGMISLIGTNINYNMVYKGMLQQIVSLIEDGALLAQEKEAAIDAMISAMTTYGLATSKHNGLITSAVVSLTENGLVGEDQRRKLVDELLGRLREYNASWDYSPTSAAAKHLVSLVKAGKLTKREKRRAIRGIIKLARTLRSSEGWPFDLLAPFVEAGELTAYEMKLLRNARNYEDTPSSMLVAFIKTDQVEGDERSKIVKMLIKRMKGESRRWVGPEEIVPRLSSLVMAGKLTGHEERQIIRGAVKLTDWLSVKSHPGFASAFVSFAKAGKLTAYETKLLQDTRAWSYIQKRLEEQAAQGQSNDGENGSRDA